MTAEERRAYYLGRVFERCTQQTRSLHSGQYRYVSERWYAVPSFAALYERLQKSPHCESIHVVLDQQSAVAVLDYDHPDDKRCGECDVTEPLCPRCWASVDEVAVRVTRMLVFDLGLAHFTFVFSGRRGFHVWVHDRRLVGAGVAARASLTAIACARIAPFDRAVTKYADTHCIRMPYSVHPSGLVCVVFVPGSGFVPTRDATIASLLATERVDRTGDWVVYSTASSSSSAPSTPSGDLVASSHSSP